MMDIFIHQIADAVGRIEKDHVTVAIDGRCASGKTTLASELAQIFDAPVIHMDHFFLRSYQRTPDRLAEPGGNVDRERFLDEVLIPLSKSGCCKYRLYDCSAGALAETAEIIGAKIHLIEGSYSCHPELRGYYDLTVFLSVDPVTQMRRIIAREGREKAEMFRTRWIPLEERYFEEFAIAEQCDLICEV